MRWLLTRPASQLSFFLNELLFLMGSSKKERKSWRPWGGCERRLSNERSELINRALQGLSWMSWLRLMEWIAARLWAVAPPMAPPQERTSTNSTNNSNSTMKFNNEWRGMNAASACFEWNQFIDEMRDKRAASEWAGMTNQAEARQAHHFIQSISLCEGDWWMQWMEESWKPFHSVLQSTITFNHKWKQKSLFSLNWIVNCLIDSLHSIQYYNSK